MDRKPLVSEDVICWSIETLCQGANTIIIHVYNTNCLYEEKNIINLLHPIRLSTVPIRSELTPE